KRGAGDVSNPNKTWPIDQVISYKLESEYDVNFAEMIRNAFKFWTDNTCLTYEENGSTTPLIRIVKGSDCSSQVVSDCSMIYQLLMGAVNTTNVGTIVHEIAHSIGLGHTHMRDDRDAYITINFDNL
ncbi:hypothetical protein PMAYCL1PPCAC_13417, partial [Pristionchus mayeri]